nr:MAG TPA: hypothetical protein [Caudoviricetes sp.]
MLFQVLQRKRLQILESHNRSKSNSYNSLYFIGENNCQMIMSFQL